MPLLYLDTNVIMDFLLERDSAAFRLLSMALQCKHRLIISELAIKELKYNNLEYETKNLINLLDDNSKLISATITKQDIYDAEIISKSFNTDFNDILHKVICKRLDADVLVTKNLKDFNCFTDVFVR